MPIIKFGREELQQFHPETREALLRMAAQQEAAALLIAESTKTQPLTFRSVQTAEEAKALAKKQLGTLDSKSYRGPDWSEPLQQ